MNDKERSLVTLLLGVDSLLGGDIKGGAADRFLLDSYFSGEELPVIYADEVTMRIRQSGGVLGKADSKDVAEMISHHDLFSLAKELSTGFGAD